MACPTCDHTMQSLGYADGGTIWHCPRCGTVKHHDQFTDAEPAVFVPTLVERCRAFRVTMYDSTEISEWNRRGIAEAINPPSQRAE